MSNVELLFAAPTITHWRNSFSVAWAPEQSMAAFKPSRVYSCDDLKTRCSDSSAVAFVDTTVTYDGKSRKVRVHQFRNGVASAPGVKGGYVTDAINWIQLHTIKQAQEFRWRETLLLIQAIEFSIVLTWGCNICEWWYGQKSTKAAPDGLIGPINPDTPFESAPNRQVACENLVEVTILAALTMTPNARAHKFKSNVRRQARDVNSKHPSYTFTQR